MGYPNPLLGVVSEVGCLPNEDMQLVLDDGTGMEEFLKIWVLNLNLSLFLSAP